MDWTEEVIQRLRALWDEGHSTAEIGRRLGVSKNAVVGKAHRLDLPARPSPIRREGSPGVTPRRAAPRRPAGPTLPPLSSIAAPGAAAGASATQAAAPRQAAPSGRVSVERAATERAAGDRPSVERALAPAPRIQVVAPRPYAREVACCWPIGEPGTPSFRFCDAAANPGKPYCAEHAALAYVKVRDRREDAA